MLNLIMFDIKDELAQLEKNLEKVEVNVAVLKHYITIAEKRMKKEA